MMSVEQCGAGFVSEAFPAHVQLVVRLKFESHLFEGKIGFEGSQHNTIPKFI
jgi:hypothetical protein